MKETGNEIKRTPFRNLSGGLLFELNKKEFAVIRWILSTPCMYFAAGQTSFSLARGYAAALLLQPHTRGVLLSFQDL